jgi:hypothetical protein
MSYKKNAFHPLQFKAAKAQKIGSNLAVQKICSTKFVGFYRLSPPRFKHPNFQSLYQFAQLKHGREFVAGRRKS